MRDVYPESAMKIYFIAWLNVFFGHARASFTKIARHELFIEPQLNFNSLFPCHIFISYRGLFFTILLMTVHTLFIVPLLEITFLNIVTIFLAVIAVLVLSVLVVALLNRGSTFIEVSTILVFFSLRKNNTLVVVCNTVFACFLELVFNVEIFKSSLEVFVSDRAVIWSYLNRELVTNPLDS